MTPMSVTYAREHLFERSAVESGRSILTAALDRGMGEASFSQVRQEFDRRAQSGEFRTVQHGPKHEGQQYTTAETLRMERETIGHVKNGNQRGFADPMLVDGRTRIDTEERHPELNAGQRQAVDEVFLSREKIVGLDGVAGAGKTTALAVVREGAENAGYQVEGFAPTVRDAAAEPLPAIATPWSPASGAPQFARRLARRYRWRGCSPLPAPAASCWPQGTPCCNRRSAAHPTRRARPYSQGRSTELPAPIGTR